MLPPTIHILDKIQQHAPPYSGRYGGGGWSRGSGSPPPPHESYVATVLEYFTDYDLEPLLAISSL